MMGVEVKLRSGHSENCEETAYVSISLCPFLKVQHSAMVLLKNYLINKYEQPFHLIKSSTMFV